MKRDLPICWRGNQARQIVCSSSLKGETQSSRMRRYPDRLIRLEEKCPPSPSPCCSPRSAGACKHESIRLTAVRERSSGHATIRFRRIPASPGTRLFPVVA
jgi:hypothetical protein